MILNVVYKEEKDWFIGHLQEYPDYESQGKTFLLGVSGSSGCP